MIQDKFLFENTAENENSAKIIINEIFQYFNDSKSFIDLGCGLGAWSAVFESKGIHDFKCYDHPSVPIEKLLIDKKNNFTPIDLEEFTPSISKVDFCICIEVFEHFTEANGERLLSYLTECSDLIIFSAAIPSQSGIGHKNEQRHNYWHNKFARKGYAFYDGFKSQLFSSEYLIKFYHIQNIFIYYRNIHKTRFQHLHNVSSQRFELVARDILEKPIGVGSIIKELPNAILRSLKHRLK